LQEGLRLRYFEPDSGAQTLTFPETLPGVELGARALSPAWVAVGIGERLAAAALLAMLLPVLAVIGIAIWLLSRRPPLVAHARVGQGGAPIWVLKFRSMWSSSAPRSRRIGALVERLRTEPVPELKNPQDPRITSRFAAICRKFSIDELPQLWHVAEGRMSLVGPRPMTADELAEHYGTDAGKVLVAKPGLTGLWQVRGRSSLTHSRRRRLDLFLVRKTSVRLYMAILFATIPRVLTGKDAW
jgi:lipopolysaccharide/colanic/teichoic acid biosynthesis glycosyltransferase